MFELLKKTIWLGAGLAIMTTEKIEGIVAEFVRKGQLSEKEGKELVTHLIERSKKAKEEMREKIEKAMQDALQKLNIPTRKEMEDLRARIERLEKQAEKKK